MSDEALQPAKQDDWELVDVEDVKAGQASRRELYRKRLEQESAQAGRAQVSVGTAIADVNSGSVVLADSKLREVHQLCSIPGTAVRIAGLSCECPPVIHTAESHNFFSGQVVIISGIVPSADETARGAASLVRLLNRDHIIVVVDACRFSLCGLEALLPEGDRCLDLAVAEVSASIGSWAFGKAPLAHSVLDTAAQAAAELGMVRLCSLAYSAVRNSCSGVQHVADLSARNIDYAGRVAPPGNKVQSLKVIRNVLKRVSGIEGPALRAAAHNFWDIVVERTQPSYWAKACESSACSECLVLFAKPTECENIAGSATAPCGAEAERMGKHHCRHCGRVVCDLCSKDREPVPWYGYLHKVRVCRGCVGVVKMRNLSVQHYQSLTDLLDMAVSGVWRAEVEQKPAQARGRPPGPPPPPSGKGKGKQGPRAAPVPSKAPDKDARKAKGLSALGEGMEDALGELAEFVVLLPETPPVSAVQPGGAMREPGIAILTGRELFPWHVARRAYEPYLDEIYRCLSEVTLESAKHAEEWLPALQQVLPLESKVSAGTMAQFKALDTASIDKLRIYEQQICKHFLPVPKLGLRLSALFAFRDMQAEREKLASAIAAAKLAYMATLDRSEEGHMPKLRDEVRDFLAALTFLTKRDDLQGLAQSTQVGKGRKLLESAWQAGEQGHKLCNARGFLEALAPVLLGEPARPAAEMLDILQRILDRQRDRASLRLASSESGDAQLADASERLAQFAACLEDQLVGALAEGRHLQIALYQLGAEATPYPSLNNLAACRELATDLDECVLSLRQLVQGLQDARQKVSGNSCRRASEAQDKQKLAKVQGEAPAACSKRRKRAGTKRPNRMCDQSASSSENLAQEILAGVFERAVEAVQASANPTTASDAAESESAMTQSEDEEDLRIPTGSGRSLQLGVQPIISQP